MKNNPEHPAEDDAVLFRQSVPDVIPLAPIQHRQIISPSPRRIVRTKQVPVPTVADTLSEQGAPDIPLSEYLSNGINRMTLRKLRRGTWPPQDSLDLHGLTTDGARKLLMEFLHQAHNNKLRCVHVIHGKGWRSEGREGVLKIYTRHWLVQHQQVMAFCEAPLSAGGGGAVWVLLKIS